ncbi:MAG: hypothetical protein AAGH81_08980 [Bacteroidota bacterium]
MKKTILLYISAAIWFLNCANTTPAKHDVSQLNAQDKKLLKGIQDKIFNAFVQTNIQKDPKALLVIKGKLQNLADSNSNNVVTYWQSYLQYYLSICYMTQGDPTQAEEEIDRAVDLMEDMNDKNSEDYALLALAQSFSIQFKGFKAMFISSAIQKNGKRSMAMEPKNIRAYYVLGNSDFYTPEQYGGGEEVESLLLKAIALPEQLNKNPYLPSWGKAESYQLLVRHYLKSDDKTKAKTYCKEGLAQFPNNYGLGKLAIELLD